MTTEPTRLATKREKTRQTIVDAARDLVSESCHGKVSIQDITLRADVGLGTFYNYFENKQDVFEAVLSDFRIGFEERLQHIRALQSDPASLVSATLKFSFAEALDNTQWREFVQLSGMEGEHLLLQSTEQCLEDVTSGAKGGRFKVDDPEFVANIICGMTHHVTREILAQRLERTAIVDAARYILRMLGLPELVAKAVTQAPLPPIAAQKRQVAKEILPFLSNNTQLS